MEKWKMTKGHTFIPIGTRRVQNVRPACPRCQQTHAPLTDVSLHVGALRINRWHCPCCGHVWDKVKADEC